jgi:hypothetical protein
MTVFLCLGERHIFSQSPETNGVLHEDAILLVSGDPPHVMRVDVIFVKAHDLGCVSTAGFFLRMGRIPLLEKSFP